MTRNIKKLMVLSGVVLLLAVIAAACVPGELQDAIRATQADVTAIKTDVAAMKKDAAPKLDKILAGDSDINQAERDIKEHVVRGRADFIAFNDNFDKMNKSFSSNITTLVGTPAKKAKDGSVTPAKPGIVQNIDTKLDRLVGVAGKPATPAKEDPKTGKPIAAKPAVPAKPGLIDDVNAKLDKLVGTPEKPAVAAKLDKKTGKVVSPAQPAVPAKPGAIDDVMAQLKDIKERLAKIEQSAAPAPAPAPAPTAAPAAKP